MRGLGLYRQARRQRERAVARHARHPRRLCRRRERLARPTTTSSSASNSPLIKLLSGGRYRPEPWRPADSLVWAKLMALGLDGNWRAELLRLRLRAQDRRRRREVPDRAAGRQPRRDAVAGQRGAERHRPRPALPRHRQYRHAQARGVQRMGAVGRAFGVGQAACSPTTRTWRSASRHLVSRAPGRAGLRHPRRHLARLARRRARPQRHDRLGLHHHQPRQPGPVHRAASIRPIPTATSRPTARGRSACATRRSTSLWGDPVPAARARDAARRGDRRLHPPPDDLTPQGHVLALQATALDGSRHLGRGLRPLRAGARTGTSS